jgi:tRNA1Val (adenine37-N6)-methyltransferase
VDFDAGRAKLEAEMGAPITVDALTARVRIFQRKRGHRHSTDDLLTGAFALEHAPASGLHLDLGSGIGSVGLIVHDLRRDLALTCIEAQDVSFRLLEENVRANGFSARLVHGDLRELSLEDRFALVTGSPPYFPAHTGIIPADSQKAHARFELRGDIADYARAARRHLEPSGRFVVCFPYAQKARALAALRAEGLAASRIRDIVPRAGLPPLFSLFLAALEAEPLVEERFVVRDADGTHTDAMHAVRARLGFEPQLKA